MDHESFRTASENGWTSPLLETFAKAQTQEAAQSGRLCEAITYWGILCRTCRALVAFDVKPYVSFGPDAAGTRAGSIRCAAGHTHIYFPRDFQFIFSEEAVSEQRMQDNRSNYAAANPRQPVALGARRAS